ncbi:MAG TPA: hypothetical protein PK328_05015 [Chitinophagaceae bacterium]|nr:hypothetical protein [Chitinophagaceae bacterium]
MDNEYKIYSETSIKYLEVLINKAINKGWKPVGGVSAVHADLTDYTPDDGSMEGVIYMQAMVRYANN